MTLYVRGTAFGSKQAGTFRLRPKVHIAPLCARPAMAINGLWLQPCSRLMVGVSQSVFARVCAFRLLDTDDPIELALSLVVKTFYSLPTFPACAHRFRETMFTTRLGLESASITTYVYSAHSVFFRT